MDARQISEAAAGQLGLCRHATMPRSPGRSGAGGAASFTDAYSAAVKKNGQEGMIQGTAARKAGEPWNNPRSEASQLGAAIAEGFPPEKARETVASEVDGAIEAPFLHAAAAAGDDEKLEVGELEAETRADMLTASDDGSADEAGKAVAPETPGGIEAPSLDAPGVSEDNEDAAEVSEGDEKGETDEWGTQARADMLMASDDGPAEGASEAVLPEAAPEIEASTFDAAETAEAEEKRETGALEAEAFAEISIPSIARRTAPQEGTERISETSPDALMELGTAVSIEEMEGEAPEPDAEPPGEARPERVAPKTAGISETGPDDLATFDLSRGVERSAEGDAGPEPEIAIDDARLGLSASERSGPSPGRLAADGAAIWRPEAGHPARQVGAALIEISYSAGDGVTEVALSPEELGKVRLSMQRHDGAMTVTLTAERPETLELMRRHVGILSEEFAQMGFGDVSFAFGQQSRQETAFPTDMQRDVTEFVQSIGAAARPDPAGPEIAAGAGLDLRL